jgi:F0F1-type ATP synthase alpha subunit
MEASYADVGKKIAESKDLNAATEETLKKAIQEFKQGFNK